MSAPKYVLAIDEGTTSTRAILFDKNGVPKHSSQQEFTQIYPQPGWTEHDPAEIYSKVEATVADVMRAAGASASDVAAIGITNQRETTVAWDLQTGRPLHNALVWLDLRTAEIAARLEAEGGKDRFRAKTGLPVSTYFSAVKMVWLMENVPAVADAAAEGRCLFGTIDSWILYNMTGGVDSGGVHNHLTDVTNASRTMLMDLKTLNWDKGICEELGIPVHCLPQIRSNSEELGRVKSGPLAGVPITATIGDQHAALLGQGCTEVGEVKNTYGTGCFMVVNTGAQPMPSSHGLLTTMSWKLGPDSPPVYALEGAVAVAGRGVQWLRDQLKIIDAAPEVGDLAASVPDSGGVTFVPGFSGLLAPWWRSDARGALVGMTLQTSRGHIARAMLEGVAFQTVDVMRAMEQDIGHPIKAVKTDGGLTQCDLMMQIQADVMGSPVLRAKMPEATALGAAFAAGLHVGFYSGAEEIHEILKWHGGYTQFKPVTAAAEREAAVRRWHDAISRSLMDSAPPPLAAPGA